MMLRDFVLTDAILPDLSSSQRDEVVAELVDALIEAGAAPKKLRDTLIAEVLKREKNGSTGFGKGVAIPHVKHAEIKKVAAAIGVSQSGVDYNALDKQPVYSIFMLLSPADQPDQHLHAMETIFANLQNDTFRSFLRQADSRDAVLTLLEEADTQQL
jgi:mannitol/fructose-specific phosphotransferase system IIA component (Ntr-type)